MTTSSVQLYSQQFEPPKKEPENGIPQKIDMSKVVKVEVSLEINTGNLIYEEFDNIEDAFEFMQTYAQNPDKILERITPRALRK